MKATRNIFSRNALLWLGVFAAFALLYGLTAQRGCSWGDSGIFQWRVLHAQYQGNGGDELALAHPLYIALARAWTGLWPSGRVFLAINAFSGVAMAAALATLVLVLVHLTGDRLLSVLVAAALGMAHTPWWLATVAEVYTLSLAAFMLELLLLLRFVERRDWRTGMVLLLVNGVHVSVHNLALLSLPVYVVLVMVFILRRCVSWRQAVLMAVAYLLGASPYLSLVVRRALETGSLISALRSALVGTWGGAVAAWRLDGSIALFNGALVGLNFVGLLLPLALVGVWTAWKRRGPAVWALTAVAALHVVFVVTYNVPDVFSFTLPVLAMIALFAGLGGHVLAGRSVGARRLVIGALLFSVAWQPLAYGMLPGWLDRNGFSLTRQGKAYPLRRELRYWISPWKHDEASAERFARAALEQSAPDGLIRVGNPHLLYPLKLASLRRAAWRHVDVDLYDKRDPDMRQLLEANVQRRVYVVRPYLQRYITDRAVLRPEGVLYRVELAPRGPGV